MKWLFALGLIAVAVVGSWIVPRARSEDHAGVGVIAVSVAGAAPVEAAPTPSPVGTSGTHAAAEDHAGDVIMDIETITGANDGMALVGRRVDLHVDVQGRANDHAFWVGTRDNRLLVVLARDTRDDAARQSGHSSGHGLVPVTGGQRAAISGVVQRVPRAEDRASWNLTRADERELADRMIYVHADTVASEGHGTR